MHTYIHTYARSSACEDDDRKKKLAKVNKDVARVEWSIANLLDEGGDLEKAQVYYLHSKRVSTSKLHAHSYIHIHTDTFIHHGFFLTTLVSM